MLSRKNLKDMIAALTGGGVATLGVAAICAAVTAPAEAGMGTGRPNPPPPPPPYDITGKCLERGTIGGNTQEKSFAGCLINHTVSNFDGSATKLTDAGGNFKYTLRQGQPKYHVGTMFGLTKPREGGGGAFQDYVYIGSDSKVRVTITGGQDNADYDAAVGSGGNGIDWEIRYQFAFSGTPANPTWEAEKRLGGAAGPTIVLSKTNRVVTVGEIPRHVNALPLGSRGNQPLTQFKVTALTGFKNINGVRTAVAGWKEDNQNRYILQPGLRPGDDKPLPVGRVVFLGGK